MGQEGQEEKLPNKSRAGICISCGIAGNNWRRKQLLGAESEPSVNEQSRETRHGEPRWAGRRVLRGAELQQLIINPWQTGGTVVLPNPLRLLIQKAYM